MRKKSWVKGRASCTTDSAFGRLRETIQVTVDEANELDAELRDGYTFEIHEDLNAFTVKAKAPPGTMGFDEPAVTFIRRGTLIDVNSNARFSADPTPTAAFKVHPTWDIEKGKCRLLVDGKPHKLWQIGQKALAGLFSRSWKGD